MSIKHSKFKNTYLIYEFLVRQTLNDLLDKKDLKESKAFNIIQENFSKGILKEELMLYQALVNTRMNNNNSIDYLIKECVSRHKNLSQNDLRAKKYALIGEIKKHYDINNLFSTQLPEYADAGAVYMLFEAENKSNILKKAKYMGVISENIASPKKETKGDKIFECINNASPDERELASKILLTSFNKKFTNALTESQRRFMDKYIHNNTNESGWINEEITTIKSKIKKSKSKLTDSKEDFVMGLKLDECVKKLDSISKKKIVKDEDHSKILKMEKLVDLLDDYAV